MEYTDAKELEAAVEGILFASGEPIRTDRICFALSLERAEVESILRRLRDYYAFERRGMRLLQLEDKWQLCSSPDCADAIRKAFEIRKPAKLSQPALEALTIIAYYQPTTRAYVDKLRGVDSAYTVGLLLERGLIETCGNLQAPGRPLLYRTTEKFLRSFHIRSLDELPPLNEDDAPPQQLKIEDMAQRLTDAPQASETPEAAEMPQEVTEAAEVAETPQASEIPQEVTEATPETPQEVTETAEAIEENPETPEEAIEDAPDELPEASESADGIPPDEPSIPARELMSAGYPYRISAPSESATRRKASARKPKRLAGTFRTRRKRPQKARKRRKTARPRRQASDGVPQAAPEVRNDISAPQNCEALRTASERRDASQASPESRISASGATRRKLSGKAVRRCFHCLLFGCWLSWPFC